MLTIASAGEEDAACIQRFYSELRRPLRPHLDLGEYLIARDEGGPKGCAAIHLVRGRDRCEGYLYGLAVPKAFQRMGIGRALTEARVERVRSIGGSHAVAMAMFWNVKFFGRLGFLTIPRHNLSPLMRGLPDFNDVRYRHSAIVCKTLDS